LTRVFFDAPDGAERTLVVDGYRIQGLDRLVAKAFCTSCGLVSDDVTALAGATPAVVEALRSEPLFRRDHSRADRRGETGREVQVCSLLRGVDRRLPLLSQQFVEDREIAKGPPRAIGECEVVWFGHRGAFRSERHTSASLALSRTRTEASASVRPRLSPTGKLDVALVETRKRLDTTAK
jgi:hypothetical protein